MRIILSLGLLFVQLIVCSQTFNKRLTFDSTSLETGFFCFQSDDHYLLFGGFFDTLGLSKAGSIVLNLEGEIIHQSVIYQDSTLLFMGYYSGGGQFDDGFVSCGSYNTPPYTNFLGEIVIFDSMGDTLWTKIIPSLGGEDLLLYKALKISDGFIICGTSAQFGEPSKGLLFKLDEFGEIIWRKDYLPTSTDSPISLVSAVEIPGEGFLLGGATMAAFNWNHLVIKTDDDGNEIWRKTEGDQYSNYYAMVANAADGKYVFAGQDENAEQNQARSQVTKMNVNGTIAWTQFYGEEGPDCGALAIKALGDGGFIFCGSDRSFGGGYGYICRINAVGDQLWYRKYRQTEDNWCFATDVCPTSDGGFMLTGLLNSSSQLNLPQDMWALKLDSLGCLIPGCAVGIIEEGENAAMRIYPNPADDFINVFVESKSLHNCELNLYDMQGKEIYCTTIRESGNTWMMDSSILAEGIYLLNLQLNGEVVKSDKVVVRHD